MSALDAPAVPLLREQGGEGPPLMLLHGYGADRLSWVTLQPALVPLARVHTLDLPGHGQSSPAVGDGRVNTLAQAVAPLLAEGAPPWHLVGHSLGGGVALMLAALLPQRVASLTLIAPLGLGQGVDSDFLETFTSLDDPEAAQRTLQRLVSDPRLIGRALVKGLLDQLARPGAREALAAIGAGIARSTADLQPAIEQLAARRLPTLVVWGEDDAINRPDEARIAALGAEYRLVARSGHLPHVEQAKAVGGWVAGFLGGVIGAPPGSTHQ